MPHSEDQEIDLSDSGVIKISIHAREGSAGLRERTETGELVFVPIERIKTERRGSPGRSRLYNVYRLPASHGSREIRTRMTGNEEDKRRGLNRAEHLRAIPPNIRTSSG